MPGFGVNHSRVLWCLLGGEPKTAKDISKATGLSKFFVYPVLRQLEAFGLIKSNGLHPKTFFVEEPLKFFDLQKKSQEKDLEAKKRELKKLIDNSSALSGEEYLIKINGGQTRLINKKTNSVVVDEFEVYSIKKRLEEQLVQIRNGNSAMLVARYR